MRHAIILAGGAGTRLWPASRRDRPKQLLALTQDSEPLITRALAIGKAVTDHVAIVTAASQAVVTRDVVGDVELIIEPLGRNTAAAMGLAAATIFARDPEAVIAFLPADHHVQDPEGMVKALSLCLAEAETANAIGLIGIPPTRPETGFGYLEVGSIQDGATPVLRFVEKPDIATAERYLASARYLWNSGIFCLTARRLLTELSMHMPQTAAAVQQLARDSHSPLYARLAATSFDYGIMERVHCDNVIAVPADVGWNDVGSWSALPDVIGGTNTILGQGKVIDGTGNVIVSDSKDLLIATVGISDLVVVKSGNALLIVKKGQAQRVREVVEALTVDESLQCYL